MLEKGLAGEIIFDMLFMKTINAKHDSLHF